VIQRSVILSETEIFEIDESWLPHRPSPAEPKNEIELAQEKGLIEAALKLFVPRARAKGDPVPQARSERQHGSCTAKKGIQSQHKAQASTRAEPGRDKRGKKAPGCTKRGSGT